MGRGRRPSRRDGNAVVGLVLVAVTAGAMGFAGLWLWRAHGTVFWVGAAGLAVVLVGFTVADTTIDLREKEREARDARADRTRDRFLRHLRDEPEEPGRAVTAVGDGGKEGET
jgi:hypothetical protein